MKVPEMNKDRGEDIDSFLAHKPASRIPEPLDNFDYLECTDCHHIIQLPSPVESQKWKISMMGLRPSILGVAKGVCPVCQDVRKQCEGLLARIDGRVPQGT